MNTGLAALAYIFAQICPVPEAESAPAPATEFERMVDRTKHYLWHGNLFRASQQLDDLESDLGVQEETDLPSLRAAVRRMLKHVRELRTYLENNQAFIPNYGERYRNGEMISTAIAESTVNQVISKRMVKKQQMQWTPRGAHLLLQVRTRVLNEDLEQTFREWYPRFRTASAELEALPLAA